MPYVICPLLILGAAVHIWQTGGDWMDVAWLVVGIGGFVGSVGVDLSCSRSRQRTAAPAVRETGGE
jgi:hypothetical protein